MRIFLSYRRDDASAWAGRLHDALTSEFGQRNLWQDVTAVRPGENFSDAIDAALAESDVVLAVIGPRWLAATTSEGDPRLTRPDDYVRIELTAALEQGKQVIPVLVGGAAMPTPAQLPEGLQGLGLRQAVVLRDETWRQDVDGFIRSLRGKTATTRGPRRMLVAAAVIALLLVGGLAGWLVLGRDGEGSPNGDTGQETPVALTTELESCPTTAAWTDLGVTEDAVVGDPGWHVTVVSGHQMERGSGGWDVVLELEAVQNTEASQTHYAAFYDLVVGGKSYEPDCFVGQDRLDPRQGRQAFVGFQLPDELTGAFSLDVDTGELGRARIDLEPAG
jgi:TIR domain